MVRKKKDIVKPVVAKPLNDNQKRNLVTSFVTNNINETVADDVTNNSSDNVTSTGTNNLTEKVNDNNTSIVTNSVKDEVTKSVTDNGTSLGAELVTESRTIEVTNKDTKSVTKKAAKKVNIIKSITIGKRDIVAKFTSDKKLRPNYNLSEDTIEKIEKISEILGYKKAEFVDIYLNGTLEKVLKDLEKKL